MPLTPEEAAAAIEEEMTDAGKIDPVLRGLTEIEIAALAGVIHDTLWD